MVVITNTKDVVTNHGDTASRVDEQREKDLIKVRVGVHYYYIGTVDRRDWKVNTITKDAFPDDFAPGRYLHKSGAFELNPDYREQREVI